MSPELRADLVSWLADRPDDVRALARRFPPACRVRALVPMIVPGPGEVGIVISYGERGPAKPNGWLGVVSPDGLLPYVKAVCLPADLEVVPGGEVSCDDIADVLADLERIGPAMSLGPISKEITDG